nr:band 7 protein AGAP004871-like isoform X5 [Maniola hyperantus]
MQTELRSVSTRRDNVPSHCDTGMTCAITIQMPNPEATGCVEKFATFCSFLLVIVTFPFSLFECFKVVQEFERAVIFRLGRLRSGGVRGPGLFFVLPCVDTYRKVDLRTVSFDVPPQEVLTRDSVTVAVDAVVYYRIKEPLNAVIRVADYSKDVRLPVQLQRAMAAEAEADREARAKIIAAEGEIKASKALREASLVMIDNPTALQLRYLQSLNTISAEKNSTIIFPFPMDFLKTFLSGGGGAGPCIPPPPLPV